jgi:hypothetical protein
VFDFKFTLHSVIILLQFSQYTPSKKVGIGWYWWVNVGIFHTHHYHIRNSQTHLRFALSSMRLAKKHSIIQSILQSLKTLVGKSRYFQHLPTSFFTPCAQHHAPCALHTKVRKMRRILVIFIHKKQPLFTPKPFI